MINNLGITLVTITFSGTIILKGFTTYWKVHGLSTFIRFVRYRMKNLFHVKLL